MLNKMTRCDRCPAEAQQEVFIFGTVLLFCQHHYNKHELALMAQGGEVLPQEEAPTPSPEDVAFNEALDGIYFE